MEVVPVTNEVRERPSFRALRRAWPTFMLRDPVSDALWGRLYSERPEFQFALVDGDEVLAEGNSIPVCWDGTVEGLPAEGWEWALLDGFEGDGPATAVSALAVLVSPERQGEGLSRVMLEHMRAIAHGHGFDDLLAPVRPSLKHRYPLVPIERYVLWRRDDGLLFDPWLRAHERVGGEVVAIAPASMTIPGTVAEWEEWAGMAFPESGRYTVPGALTPVEIDREADRGVYVEPNVWMRHRL